MWGDLLWWCSHCKLTFHGLLMPLKNSGIHIGKTTASLSNFLASTKSAISSLKERSLMSNPFGSTFNHTEPWSTTEHRISPCWHSARPLSRHCCQAQWKVLLSTSASRVQSTSSTWGAISSSAWLKCYQVLAWHLSWNACPCGSHSIRFLT